MKCIVCGEERTGYYPRCLKCGTPYENDSGNQYQPEPVRRVVVSYEPKIIGSGQGFVFGLFLSILGVLVCQLFGDEDAKKSAWITFIVMIVLSLLSIIIIYS